MESEISLEFRSDLSKESLEGELSNVDIGALLEASYFKESDGAGSEPLIFFDTACSDFSYLLSGNPMFFGAVGLILLICSYFLVYQPAFIGS